MTDPPHIKPDQRLLAVAIQTVANAVMITDVIGTIAWVNRAFTRMSGYTVDEAVGSTPRILKSGAHDAEHYARLWKTILEGGVWQGEVVERHKDGHLYTVMQTITPVVGAEGQIDFFVAVHQDVTASREAESGLLMRTQMLDAVGDAVIATDLDGLVRYMNPAAQQLFGWTLADAEGVPISQVAPADALTVEAETVEAAVRGGELWAGEFNLTRADGSMFPALITQAPYKDAAGNLAGGIGVARDISELRSTIDRLEQSEQIRVAFLRATSHELRTPLTAIVGFLDTLRRHNTELDDSERSLYLERLAVNADRLTRLVTDLLDLDRLETGLVTANRQPEDLKALVMRVVDEVDAGDRHIDLELASIVASIDGPKIERALANLLANAIRHTPPEGNIQVELLRDARATVLRVLDDGPGIDETYLPLIFDPFVQGPERHDDAKPGTGLGLSLALEMVRMHGGNIVASNRPAGGACFEMRLPDGA